MNELAPPEYSQFLAAQSLIRRVLEVGQNTHDTSKIPGRIMATSSNGLLGLQVAQDVSRKYKFCDALAMWLGQADLWRDQEIEWLITIATNYIEERKKNYPNDNRGRYQEQIICRGCDSSLVRKGRPDYGFCLMCQNKRVEGMDGTVYEPGW